jgi:hypothetical protein
VAEKKKIQVELVVAAQAHEIRADRALFVTINPYLGHIADQVEYEIRKLVGHSNVVVMPLPLDEIRFYQIEHPYVIGVDMAADKDRSVE